MTISTTPASTDTSSAKEAESKPTKSEHYYDDRGDLEILSSDNVLFRLHAYRLQASSSVFRDMLQDGANQPKTIELTDEELETSKVITNLFDIMIKEVNVLDIADFAQGNRSAQKLVILFAQKYDFAYELRIIKHQLQAALSLYDDNKRALLTIFNLSLMLDEHTLCANALRKGGSGWMYGAGAEPGQEKTFGECLKGSKIFDLTGCSLEHMRQMPVEVIWALARTRHKPSALSGVELQAEHDAMAEKYMRLMALKGAPRFA